MIDKEEFEKASFEENQKFIKKILKLATHNSFTKDDLLFLIKWQNAIIEKMKCCGNCKKYRMPESQVPLSCLKNQRINSCCEGWEIAE
jgi:hypothetical protein